MPGLGPGFPAGTADVQRCWLRDSGYDRLQVGPAVALLDVAPIGPDYLPGHAHADTLSFELSLFGQRVIVNGGTSRYGSGPERLAERGSAPTDFRAGDFGFYALGFALNVHSLADSASAIKEIVGRWVGR